jgi:hypothetical protein
MARLDLAGRIDSLGNGDIDRCGLGQAQRRR